MGLQLNINVKYQKYLLRRKYLRSQTIESLEPGTKIAVIEFLWWAVLLAVSVEAPSLALVPFEQLDLIIGVLKFAASKAAAVPIHAPPWNGPDRFDFYPTFSEVLVEVRQELREQRDRRDVDEGQVPPGERRGPGSAPLALVHVVHDLLLLPPPVLGSVVFWTERRQVPQTGCRRTGTADKRRQVPCGATRCRRKGTRV